MIFNVFCNNLELMSQYIHDSGGVFICPNGGIDNMIMQKGADDLLGLEDIEEKIGQPSLIGNNAGFVGILRWPIETFVHFQPSNFALMGVGVFIDKETLTPNIKTKIEGWK